MTPLIHDWMANAAAAIATIDTSDVTQVREIIERHCPFKPDTAYEEVRGVATRPPTTLIPLAAVDASIIGQVIPVFNTLHIKIGTAIFILQPDGAVTAVIHYDKAPA